MIRVPFYLAQDQVSLSKGRYLLRAFHGDLLVNFRLGDLNGVSLGAGRIIVKIGNPCGDRSLALLESMKAPDPFPRAALRWPDCPLNLITLMSFLHQGVVERLFACSVLHGVSLQNGALV